MKAHDGSIRQRNVHSTVVIDSNGKGLERPGGGEAADAPCADLISCAVPGTFDYAILDFSPLEREILMGTDTVERVDFAVDVAKDDFAAGDGERGRFDG